MSCEDNRALLHAYVDGELDLIRSLEIEKHLESCKSCAQSVENQQAMASAMRGSSFYFRPPRELKPRVQAALRGSRKSIRWSMLAVAAGLLIAGRLDSVEGRTVAVLVYQRRQHLVNLYIWPSPNSSDSATTTTRQGYNMIHWTRAGMTWWLASDVNAADLETLAVLLRN
jgi:anti-sigma factor RsiW